MKRNDDGSIGDVVKKFRTHLGLRQEEFAELAGLGHKQTVSEIENGRRALKASELVRVAAVLQVDANALLLGEPFRDPSFVMWRGNLERQSKALAEARFHKRCRRYGFLGELSGDTKHPSVPQYSLDIRNTSYEDAAARGEEMRNVLHLGDVPGASLSQSLEFRWRVMIFKDLLAEGSGATTISEYGPAVLENATEPPSRRRFSLAHELFHLLTWNAVTRHRLSQQEIERNEKLAECFASALLMPRDVVESRLSSWSGESLLELLPTARELEVSLPALLWRMVNLGKLGQETVEKFCATRWGRTDTHWAPPTELDRPFPERFVTMAFTIYLQGEISIGKLAELLETTVGMVGHRLAQYDLDLNSYGE